MTISTNNTKWGFWGSRSSAKEGPDGTDIYPTEETVQAAWDYAVTAIMASGNFRDTAVREFLDSRHGRHFGDSVDNFLAKGAAIESAIDQAIVEWNTWKISKDESKETGIPKGTPTLIGYVAANEIAEDAAFEAARLSK